MILEELGKKLEIEIKAFKKEIEESGGLITPKVELKVCGQISLIADEVLSKSIELEGTRDLDAYRKTTGNVDSIVDMVIKDCGLIYDQLSGEIWMPEETEWEDVFKGDFVKISKAIPVYVLTSKAIKAPEKNKVLIRDGLKVLGKELEELILKYGGNPNDFR